MVYNTAMPEEQKVSRESENVQNENLAKLREVFPQFVKENTIDFNALQDFFEREGLVTGPEKYGLNWAGRSNAFQAIRVPSTGTLAPQPEESKNWDNTENLFIEGDNLEVLKLLQKHYREKIKMIYIDPPYNTGKDFVYKDNFTQGVADYYEQTGQTKNGIKMTANTEKNGRYHSDWLTMMYPRLFLARNLLKDDGVIFISIDDNEVANLRLIMDEIFGEENFYGTITWIKRTKPKNMGNAKYSLQSNTEYILVYGKISSDRFNFELPETFKKIYLEKDNKGNYRLEEIQQRKNLGSMKRDSMVYDLLGVQLKDNYRWQLSPEKRDLFLQEDKLVKNGQRIFRKIYEEEESGFSEEPFWTHRSDTDTAENAKEELENLMGADDIFDTVKPVNLIQQILYFLPKDITVLDFFAGSGTTAHAVMDLNAEDEGNRKWICVQIPEEVDEKSEAYKGGYKNIAEISRERIHRAGESIKHKVNKKIDTSGPSENKNTKPVLPLSKNIKDLDIGFKSFKLSNSNYRKWNELNAEDNIEEIKKQSKLFIEKPLVDNFDEKSVVYEILVKEGFDLNSFIKEPDKASKLPLWIIIDTGEQARKMVVTFADKITQKDIIETDYISHTDNEIFVCLDSALSDTEKVNIGRNVNLKTI